MTDTNPFTDAHATRALYSSADRLNRRSSALYAAKVQGPGAVTTIVDLAEPITPPDATVLDIGCGGGQTTIRLAGRLAPRRLVALDQSPMMLATARQRVAGVAALCADFHHLPLADATVDLVVAAFCLYHSPHPERVVTEIARSLTKDGAAILTTKSADSYAELDQLIAASGLDPHAPERPSLYTTFHTDNAAEITASALRVDRVVRQRHEFRFVDLDHVAAYVATSPKYQLPHELAGNAARLADELRRRVPNQPLATASTVAYIVGAKP